MAAETSLEFVESWRRKSYEVMDGSSDAMAAVMARALDVMSAVVREPTNEQKLERLLGSLKNEHELSKTYEQSFDPVRDLMYGTLESMRHVLQHVVATPTQYPKLTETRHISPPEQVWSEVKAEELAVFSMPPIEEEEEEVDKRYRSVVDEMRVDREDEMDGVEIVEEEEEAQRKPSIEVINLDDEEEEKEEQEEMDELSSSGDEDEDERRGSRRNKRARKEQSKTVDSEGEEEEDEDEEKEEERVVKKMRKNKVASTKRKAHQQFKCPICKLKMGSASGFNGHLKVQHGHTLSSLGLYYRCSCGKLVRSSSHIKNGKCAGRQLVLVRESETEKKSGS